MTRRSSHSALAARLRLLLCLAAALVPWGRALAEPLPAFVEKLATREQLQQLREGGYVIYLRHGITDSTRPDRVPAVDLNDCATQRPLTEAGRQLMTEVGQAMREARIPLGDIFVSPLCRAKESTEAAFGKRYTVDPLLMYTANLTTEEKRPILESTRRLLSLPVAAGTNRVVLAHAPNLADLMGYFVKPEGTAVIIRPLGDKGFIYVASIPPRRWPELLHKP